MKIAASAYPLSWFDHFDDYVAKLAAWVADAAGQGARLLVFPEYGAMELCSLGGRDVAAGLETSLREVMRHGAAVDAVHMELARAHGVMILGASRPHDAGGARPVNRATLYGPDGIIGHQDKQVMTRFERELWHVTAGRDGLQAFDTDLGRIGILICYDSEFPLLGRRLVEAGAELILVPSCTDSPAGYNRVRIGATARALEGQCVTVQSPTVGNCDFCPAVDENHGSAAIYGPPDLGFPPDGVIAQGAMDTAGWTYAPFDRDAVARVRREGAVFNWAHWGEQLPLPPDSA